MALFGTAQSRIDKERDGFIETLHRREDDVRRLASSHHADALPCEFFRRPGSDSHTARGTFNFCFFVQFCTGERWVVRIPLRPCLGLSARSKLESEVATMCLIAEKTTIPIPRVIGCSFDESADPLSTFIIMEYVGGETLSAERLKSATSSQKDNLYRTLAAVYIQLRRLEFPAIGRIVRRNNGFEVGQNALTIDTIGLELEGLNSFATQASYHGKDDALTSANEYIAMRLQISWNAFLKSRNNVETDMAGSVLYHLHLFSQHAKKWADSTLDQGPFVLVHGDLGPQNLLVNDSLEITAVIDWEWSRVVPVQFFTPPLWLTCRNTVSLSGPSSYKLYLMTALSEFLRAVKVEELSAFGECLLFTEWIARKEDGGPLVANALENWTDIDWFAYRYLSQGKDDEVEEKVKAFIEADPMRGFIVRMKEDDTVAYEEELLRLAADEPDLSSTGESKATTDAYSRCRAGVSNMAASLSSKHAELWTVQSTSIIIVTSVILLGVISVGRWMEAIPNPVAR